MYIVYSTYGPSLNYKNMIENRIIDLNHHLQALFFIVTHKTMSLSFHSKKSLSKHICRMRPLYSIEQNKNCFLFHFSEMFSIILFLRERHLLLLFHFYSMFKLLIFDRVLKLECVHCVINMHIR